MDWRRQENSRRRIHQLSARTTAEPDIAHSWLVSSRCKANAQLRIFGFEPSEAIPKRTHRLGDVLLAKAWGDVLPTVPIERHEFHAPRGELILTAPVLFGRLHILPVVTAFLAAYPEINVRLLLSDRNLHLVEEHLDMAVRIGQLPDSSMIATRIGSMRTIVCASPKLLAGRGVPEKPDDLAALPCVNFDFPSPNSAWPFRSKEVKRSIDVSIRPRLSVSTAEAAVWAAAQGVGVTRMLHYQCADAVRDGSLRMILTDFEPEPLPVHLIHAERGALASKMRVFLDFAAPRLRERLSAL
jgi:DNA-binding transcriptional LysR family regulator